MFVKQGDNTTADISDFVILRILGRGSFGKVFLVQKKDTGNYYALKCLRKQQMIEYQAVKDTFVEKTIGLLADHPFLVSMHYVFQSDDKLFFVMDFIAGGELYTAL